MSALEYFWPIRAGITFLDYWTLAHLAFWFVAGANLGAAGWPRWLSAGLCVVAAFGWEGFERAAEPMWPHIWQSPESWVNAWLSDPLTCVAGLLVAWWGYDKWRL